MKKKKKQKKKADISTWRDRVICGDSLDVLTQMPAESVDLVCTDPPFGWKFMLKNWDKALPSIDIWKECLRVLKPGAFAFVHCGPRQDCLARMILRLEEAGFEIGYSSVYWCFASGFPKSQNLSKAVDRRAGAEREAVGINPSSRPDSKKKNAGGFDSQKGEGSAGLQYDTIPATPEAKALEGAYSGFSPKPALEIILVCMKPLSEKTYLDQTLANRKGCSWLDEGRIPTAENLDGGAYADVKNKRCEVYGKLNYDCGEFQQPSGRFPANLLISDNALRGREGEASADRRYTERGGTNFAPLPGHRGGGPSGRFPANLLVSDDSLDDGSRTDTSRSYIRSTSASSDIFPGGHRPADFQMSFGDSGSFSRYFSLDSWWQERIRDLPDEARRTFPFLIVPKASTSEKTCGGQVDVKHPTIKPLKLYSWLITIGSRPGDLVLDPFCGSGTTLISAKLTSRHFVGIDSDETSVDTATQRLRCEGFPVLQDIKQADKSKPAKKPKTFRPRLDWTK